MTKSLNLVCILEKSDQIYLGSQGVNRLTVLSQFEFLKLNNFSSVLDRLERLTGAKKITSIDSMLAAPTLGTCQSFYVENSVEGINRLVTYFPVKKLYLYSYCTRWN